MKLELVLIVSFATAMGITACSIIHSGSGTPAPDADYLIVLGAGVNGTAPSRSLQERLDAAAVYLTEHPDSIAIISGGQGDGENITEAQCMFQVLTASGISPSRIWMEPNATSTAENLQFSLECIQDRTGSIPRKVAIVSSEYHLHRARILASRLGVSCDLIPAKTTSVPLRINYYLREIFAVWYYTLLGG